MNTEEIGHIRRIGLIRRIRSASRTAAPWTLGIVILGGTIAALLGKFPGTASAAWYSDDWQYRTRYRIDNTLGLGTNQTVTINIDTAALMQNNKIQGNCEDSRFTDNGGALLQYYIQSGCATGTTTYVVLVPTINAGPETTVMYHYYGNSQAPAGSRFRPFTESGCAGCSATALTEEKGTQPTLWWTFDEGYGTTANDSTLYANNGTITASWKTEEYCVSGKCLGINDTTQNVSKTYATDVELDPGTASFTIASWFRHPSTIVGTNTLISRASGTLGSEIGYKTYMNSSGNICFGIDDTAGSFPSDSACSTTSYADSTWHYLTGVKSGTSSITLYIDGNQIAVDSSLSATLTLSGSSPAFRVGVDSDGTSNGWRGLIDEVKYYKFALTAAQINANFAARGAGKAVSAVAGGGPQKYLSDGLVGYWKMDEPTWTNDCSTLTVTDSSGNGNYGKSCANGTGPTVRAGGKFGLTGSFDGINDYVDAGNVSLFDMGANQDFTLSVWVKSSQAAVAGKFFSVAVKSLGAAGYGISLHDSTTDVRWYMEIDDPNGYAAYGRSDVADGNWHHLVATRSGNRLTTYEDGTLASSIIATSGSLSNAASFLISGNVSSTLFPGQIDEVRVYRRALSGAQVEALYAWAPGPVGWWKLDEGTGTIARDSSGNGGDGTLTGTPAPKWDVGKLGSGLSFGGRQGSSEANPQYVQVADSNILDAGMVTVSAWVKMTNFGTNFAEAAIISHHDHNNNEGYYLFYQNNGNAPQFQFRLYNTTQAGRVAQADNIQLTLNQWYFVTGTYDGTNVFVYVNGVRGGTTDTATSITASNDPFRIGTAAYEGSFTQNGFIDDAKVYNYARTTQQIVEDMNGGHPTGGSPVGTQMIYYKLDEATGTTARNANNLDNSNSQLASLNGTVTGSQWRTPDLCKVNGCINFPTSTDNISVGDTGFTDSLSGMTVSLWLSPVTLATSKGIVTKSGFGSQNSFAIVTGTSSSEITVFIASRGNDTANYVVTSGLGLTTSTWAHVAIVYDGNQANANRVRVYKNGYPISTTVAGTIPTLMDAGLSSNLKVGASDSGTYTAFSAHFDEVKIYQGALTRQQVLLDMNNGSSAAMGGVLGTHNNENFSGSAPAGWWRMDENTGTTTSDFSGHGNTGTFNGNSSWIAGKIGAGVRFDGATSSFINIPDPTAQELDFADGESFSITAWVYPVGNGGSSFQSFVTKWTTGGAGYVLEYNRDTNFLRFIILDGTDTFQVDTDANTITENSWNHIAVAVSGRSSVTVYINGFTLSTTNTGTIGLVNALSNATAVRFGIDGGGNNPYDGRIDEVKIFNYALSQAQVAYDYNRGAPIGWWKLDDCQGPTAFDSSTKPGLSSVDIPGGKNGSVVIGAGGTNTSRGTCGSGTASEAWNNGTTGKYNASLDFDGDDYVTIADDNTLDLSGDFTLSAWVMWRGGGGFVISKTNAGTSGGYGMLIGGSGEMYCRTNDGATTTDSFTATGLVPANGTWVHVAVSRIGTSCRVYLNDTDVTGNFGTHTTLAANALNLIIGSRPDLGGEFWNGKIDDARIYNYGMTVTQIKLLYNGGAGVRFGPSLGSP